MDGAEFLSRYAAGEKDFRGISLLRADLTKVPLDSVDFSGARFERVKFCGSYSNCINTSVNFSDARFWDCDLTGEFSFCDFRNADMGSCDLECTRFFDCDWRGVKTKFCNFTLTRFVRVNLEGAVLKGFGEEPCEFWDVIGLKGEFIPGFTEFIDPSPVKVHEEDIDF
jgi:uncharacterized protein YjbI with pentapeptide repeats